MTPATLGERHGVKPGIDHVLVAVDDVGAAIEAYRRLGFAAAPGGTHPAFGTHNGIVPLADGGYIELIAVRDRALAVKHPHTALVVAALGRSNRLALYAIEVEDATAEAARLVRAGIRADGPVVGERVRPDGQRVAWRSLHPRDSRLPFLIEDVTPHELRAVPPVDGLGASAVIARLVVSVWTGTRLAHHMALLINSPAAPPSGREDALGLAMPLGFTTARGVLQLSDAFGSAEDGAPVLLELGVADVEALAAAWRRDGVRFEVDEHGRLLPDPEEAAGAALTFAARSVVS
jgi:hypothetical protein